VVRIGRPDASLTGLAGLVCVDELVGRLGIVAELDRGIGPVKDRDRGASAGQLLRHRLLTIPGRILRHARGLTLRLPAGHTAITDALRTLRALPPPG